MKGPQQQQRIPTAQRQMQSRMGTGYKQELNFSGIGMKTNVNIVDRPVTHCGLSGIKGQNKGPGRQVFNLQYYITLVKQRNNEIHTETNKFKKQIDDLNRDNTQFYQLDKKFDELSKEVRELEGTLADYNLALDKLRTKTRPEDISNMYQYIKAQNDKQRYILDELFIERKTQEDQLNEAEQELQRIQQQAENQIQLLDPDARQDYEKLQQENKQLSFQIQQQQMDLDNIQRSILQAEQSLKSDINKIKAKNLNETMLQVQQKKEDLEAELNESNLSFPEARDRLLARIKKDNALIAENTKKYKDLQRLCDNYEQRLREMKDEINQGKKGEESDKKKYELLYKRDKEITNFIQTFEQTRAQHMEQLSTFQKQVVENLESGSKLLAMANALPSQKEFNEIKGELNFKAGLTQNAEQTLKMLQVEMARRTEDLNKLEKAEERVTLDIQQLNDKIISMNDEIENKFDKIEEEQQSKNELKNELSSQLSQLSQSQGKNTQKVKDIEYSYNLKLKKMQQHQNYSTFNDLEKKMSNNEQSIYQMKTFIDSKLKDMNYNEKQNECLNLIDQINQIHLQRA